MFRDSTTLTAGRATERPARRPLRNRTRTSGCCNLEAFLWARSRVQEAREAGPALATAMERADEPMREAELASLRSGLSYLTRDRRRTMSHQRQSQRCRCGIGANRHFCTR
ncbi:hypothetical protein K523DRAFT_133565 [Schizophyllum commune Tattone D]|nr:hypothetical protein K523DRAFT_133565 [Schizophyllum commune Tattone D]